MVVLISGLGFLGYLAMRFLGENAGILVTGAVGGLASSTATTLAMSRKSKETPELSERLALAIVIACTLMLGRLLMVISILNMQLAIRLVPSFCLLAIPGISYGAWLFFKDKKAVDRMHTPQISNPLSLKTSLKFAFLYAGVAFAIKVMTSMNINSLGIYVVSFLSGLTDMDAIAISVANSKSLADISVSAILLATAANTLFKATLAITLGSKELRKPVVATLGMTTVIAIVYILVQVAIT